MTVVNERDIETAEKMARRNGWIRVSELQRQLGIGYVQAVRIIDELRERRIVGGYVSGCGHQLLVDALAGGGK